ncbi:MAG: hypothetical protein ACYTBJ_00355 [Planctomycetota bacterium]|jgi:hypothetical protein
MDIDEPAPDGQIWICTACGRRSKSLLGGEHAIDGGWDESCMMHAALVYEEKNEDGAWVAVKIED